MSLHSPGKAFRAALTKENPLQIVGTINANHALLAQRAGYQAIYLSGFDSHKTGRYANRRRKNSLYPCTGHFTSV